MPTKLNMQKPCLENLIILLSVPLLAWPTSLSSINLFLPQVRPQILLCGLTKNLGPQGRVLFDPPPCYNRTLIYMATLVYE